MKVLKLIAIVPLVLLSASTFAQGRQQGSRNDRDSYGSRNSYNDRDRGRGYDSGYGDRDRDGYRSSGRRYTGSRYSYSHVSPYVYYPPVRSSGLRIGLYDDYGYASYGYSGYGYYPPVRVYRPAPVLSIRLNIGGRGRRR